MGRKTCHVFALMHADDGDHSHRDTRGLQRRLLLRGTRSSSFVSPQLPVVTTRLAEPPEGQGLLERFVQLDVRRSPAPLQCREQIKPADFVV